VSTVLQIVGALALLGVAFAVGWLVGGVAAVNNAVHNPDAADELNAHRHSGIGDLERHRNRNN
jgi:hypothetical protein